MSKQAQLHTRREFLKTGLLGSAFTCTVPGFLHGTMQSLHAAALDRAVQSPTGRDAPILVVLQLSGGNDGLNSVVPYTNDHYYRARPVLAQKPGEVHRLNDELSFHPSMTNLKRLYDDGLVSVLQGIGYPNPNRSHFRSMEIWHTASDAEKVLRHGWLGRYFDHTCSGCDPSVAVHIGNTNPQAFSADVPLGISFKNPKKYSFEDPMEDLHAAMDDEASGQSISYLTGRGGTMQVNALDFLERTAMAAQVSSDQIQAIARTARLQGEFPNTALGRDLKTVAQLIGGGMPTRIYYVSLGGFDTHSNQPYAHGNLMRVFSEAAESFMNEMKVQGNLDRVLMLTFSEFGRRVSENASRGTDHGAAAPVFLLGGKVAGGISGRLPSLAPEDLFRGDLVHHTDFRSVYSSILKSHLGVDPTPILGKRFPEMDVFRNSPSASGSRTA